MAALLGRDNGMWTARIGKLGLNWPQERTTSLGVEAPNGYRMRARRR